MYLNKDMPAFIGEWVKELKEKNKWFTEVKSYGGLIQGVMEAESILPGVEAILPLHERQTHSVGVVSLGVIDDFEPDVGINQSAGFVEPGRYFDKLVKNKKTGIYII